MARLLAANSALSASLYPVEGNFALDPAAFGGPNAHVLVARGADGSALGCIGLLAVPGDVPAWGEMKSVYVSPAARGAKLGLRLIAALEAHALELGLTVIRLETGPLNPAAIELYRRAGYVERGPFGGYEPGPYSLFMERTLAANA
ncbi:putative acetyltransferase [Endobacter medicaginis]|uniref:Putative acetyltransferase n=1 Tax=Endobacter medicaginis TaxID=1181271 RepID=A0A839V0H2_9PROT|nr:GNAT family N-acetyltransferase [Endobacter medicaginis]MBB3174054.1 putative acetyltransferase [Endobacter medicaginis]MCX5476052.1 GNAT family N-acetyltransferase [Endobacter medicaginis]